MTLCGKLKICLQIGVYWRHKAQNATLNDCENGFIQAKIIFAHSETIYIYLDLNYNVVTSEDN